MLHGLLHWIPELARLICVIYFALLTGLSYWLSRRLPIDDTKKLELLSIHCPTQRLIRGLEILKVGEVRRRKGRGEERKGGGQRGREGKEGEGRGEGKGERTEGEQMAMKERKGKEWRERGRKRNGREEKEWERKGEK